MIGRMAWSACDSGTAKSFTSRKAGVAPTRAATRGSTNSSESPRYSTGTPGRPRARPGRAAPGSPVRCRSGSGGRSRRAGSGPAWRCSGVISRPSFRKRSRMASSEGSCELERHAHGGRHHLGGQVVLGGAEAAAHDHQVGAGGGLAQRGGEVLPVVGDQRLAPRHDAQVPEPVHEPGRVGVDDLAGEELVAGGEELDVQRGRGRVGSRRQLHAPPVKPAGAAEQEA